MRLAREAARQAIERSFAMPLKAAGIDDAKVVARFAGEERPTDPTYLDRRPHIMRRSKKRAPSAARGSR